MGIYVMGIQNDMIKPSDNGGLVSAVDSVTQKVLICDTILRSFIPPQVWKLLPNYVRFADVRFALFPRICRLV